MPRLLRLVGLLAMMLLVGCGPLITGTLCAQKVIDCTNGRDAQEAKK